MNHYAMSPQVVSLIKGSLPLFGLLAFAGIAWVVKILIERKRNIERATDHVEIEVWPEVGKAYNYLTPILDGNTVRIQSRNGKEFARYILSEGGSKKVNYPPGKINFVQTTVDKLIFREGDAIPMSIGISDRPIFDAHQLDALLENTATTTAEVIQISKEESKGTVRKSHPLMWVYILLLINVAIGIYLCIERFGGNKMISQLADLVKKALGVQ